MSSAIYIESDPGWLLTHNCKSAVCITQGVTGEMRLWCPWGEDWEDGSGSRMAETRPLELRDWMHSSDAHTAHLLLDMPEDCHGAWEHAQNLWKSTSKSSVSRFGHSWYGSVWESSFLSLFSATLGTQPVRDRGQSSHALVSLPGCISRVENLPRESKEQKYCSW